MHPATLQINHLDEHVSGAHDYQYVANVDLVDGALEKSRLPFLGLTDDLGTARFRGFQCVWLDAGL